MEPIGGAQIIDIMGALKRSLDVRPNPNATPLTEQELRDGFVFFQIPEHLQGGLERYFLQRIPTGGFLRRVLSGDRDGAIAAADATSRGSVDHLFAFLDNVAPAGSFGTPEAVDSWLAQR